MGKRWSVWTAAIFAATSGLCTTIAAAQSYPTKPVRFVVPFAPGGGTDIIARVVAQGLSEKLGQSFVVDNRPGAGSLLGAEIVAGAPPDGYTLLLGNISNAFNVGLYKVLPFDPARDLRSITLVADQPNLLVVTPKLPAATFKKFVAYARANPGKVAYASAGTGSGTHLAAELLGLDLKLDLLHIPYKGTGPALTDLIGGQVQMMLSTFASALPHVKTGRLRALAVTSRKRSPAAPDVPTVEDSGVAGYEYSTWYGLFAPGKLPKPLLASLFAATTTVVQSPDIGRKLQEQGVDAVISDSPEAFSAYVNAEIKKWVRVMRAANIPQQ
jgi:tripartite-type tricarboxylate transporter receptor subunit TctC